MSLSYLARKWRTSNLLKTVVTGTGLALGIRVLGVGLGYALEIILARLLGPGDYGVYSLVIAWITLAALFAPLGLHHAVVRFIPEYIAQEDGARLRGVIYGSGGVTVALGIVIAALGSGALLLAARKIVIPGLPAWMLGLWLLPVFALLRLILSIAVSLRRVVTAFGPPLVGAPLLILLFLAVATLLGIPLAALVAVAAAGLARIITLLWQALLLKRGGLPIPARGAPRFEMRLWLAVGLPLMFFDLFSIILRRADLLMVGALMTPADAGIYGAALKTTGQTIFLLTSVNAVIAPMLSSMHAKQNKAGLQRLLYLAAHISFWPALLFVAALTLFSNFILGLFGPAFVAARTPMIILGVGQLFNAATGVVVSLLIVTGNHNTVTKVFGVSAALYILAAYVGITLWGLTGAAAATALIMALWNIWLAGLAWKRLGLHTSIIAAMRALPGMLKSGRAAAP